MARDNLQASYYRARYYDGSTGRFNSEDPIRFNAKQLNFYPYVTNNPVGLADPLGTCPQFDSVTDYHLRCEKIPTVKDRCGCHCVYVPDFQNCVDTCASCVKKDAKVHDICLCQCKIFNQFLPVPLKCEKYCKGIQ